MVFVVQAEANLQNHPWRFLLRAPPQSSHLLLLQRRVRNGEICVHTSTCMASHNACTLVPWCLPANLPVLPQQAGRRARGALRMQGAKLFVDKDLAKHEFSIQAPFPGPGSYDPSPHASSRVEPGAHSRACAPRRACTHTRAHTNACPRRQRALADACSLSLAAGCFIRATAQSLRRWDPPRPH